MMDMEDHQRCPPMFMRNDKHSMCTKWTNEVIDYITHYKELKNIVITYRINHWLYGEHRNNYPNLPNEVSEDERKKIWDSYINTANHFAKAGKKVYLVLQPPEVYARVEKIVLTNNKNSKNLVGIPLHWWNKRTAYLKEGISKLDKAINVIDPSKSLCDLENCYLVKNNRLLYFDQDHLSLNGANLIADEILKLN